MTADLAARIARLRQDFRVSFAQTSSDFEDLYHLRYDVFCSQRGILPGQEGIESDPYDSTSRHVVLRRVGGEMVGTVRLVPGVHEGQRQRFPMQRVCDPAVLSLIPLETTGEISRFCLSRDRRDTEEYADSVLRLGLMKGILRASEEAKLTHWCAAMEKGLLRLLRLAAIWFEPVGPPIEYFGTRQPAVADIAEVLKRGERERRIIWEYVTDNDARVQLPVAARPIADARSVNDMSVRDDLETPRQQNVLARLVELAFRSENLDEMLAGACRLVGEGLGTDFATAFGVQEDRHSLLVRASSWKITEGSETTVQGTDQTAEALALRTGEPIISADIDLETRFSYPPHLRASGVRAVASLVITDHRGSAPFGILQVFSRAPREFKGEDLQFLRRYATLLAAAVDRLRGIETMRRGAARLCLAFDADEGRRLESDAAGVVIADAPKITEIVGAAEPAPSVLSPAAGLSAQLRILVVDDSAINREITSAFLRSAGHEVVLAAGGAEAVRLAAGATFDVVLMDVRMPDVDGLEATRRIRADSSERGRVPILALTAQAFAEQLEECRKARMDGHLAKPFTRETLLDAVSQATAGTDRLPGMQERTGADQVKAAPVAALPTAATDRSIDTDGLILNYATFARTAAFLAPHTLESHLRTLIARSESLLAALSAIGTCSAGSNFLGAASHTLAGGAGMFGFERLAALAGRFEHAVNVNKADILHLVPGLRATINASLEEMLLRVPVAVARVSMSGADTGQSQGGVSVIQPDPRPFRRFGHASAVSPLSSSAAEG